MIYADHAATTPALPEVIAAMVAVLDGSMANPESRQHPAGRAAAAARERAREQIAALIAAHADDLIFTSGATEAINLALRGVIARTAPERRRIVLIASEHAAVRATAAALTESGCDVATIGVDRNGCVDQDAWERALRTPTALACAMLVNNETGVIHDVPALAASAHRHGALLLCDATQALLRVPLDVGELGADFVSMSAHKCHGPMGSGALWMRRGLGIAAQLSGGGQERERRGGTPNLLGLVGFGVAAAWLLRRRAALQAELRALSQAFEQRIADALPGVVIHGAAAPRAPGITMLTLPGLRRGWLNLIADVALSSGSACSSDSATPSAVLTAMGVPLSEASNGIRVSFAATTTHHDVEHTANAIIAAAQRLRA